MKKHAIALACLAGLTGAYGQVASTGGGPVTSSSVTLFGVVDLAVAWGDGSLTSNTRLQQGSHTSSRLGFRGVEDLGGGLGVGFWLEMGVNVDDGTGQTTNTNNTPGGATTNTSLTFNRRSTLSMMGDWGEVRLGRDFTATFRNRDQTDPFGTNGVGASQVNVGTIAGVTSTRASNMVAYFLPAHRLGGFFGEAQYFMGESATTDDGDGWQARLGYATQTWGIAGAWGVTRNAQTAALGDIEVWNVGAHWNFGWATLTAGYFEDTVEATTEIQGDGFIVGATIPFGAGAIRAAYSQYGTDAAGDPETRKIAIGYVHNLSKRTALYATYAHVDNRGSATTSLNGSTTAAGANADGIDVGLKHSF